MATDSATLDKIRAGSVVVEQSSPPVKQ